jgi:hypothetical protein
MVATAERSHSNSSGSSSRTMAGVTSEKPRELKRADPTHQDPAAGPAAATSSGGDALPSHSAFNRAGDLEASTQFQEAEEASSTQSNVTVVGTHGRPITTSKDEEDSEKKNLVEWDGPDDPHNPINFTEGKKWTILLVIGSATLACTCASSMVASTYTGMMEEFHVSREVATLSLTL